jgi:preprotein translocase subunit SecE
MAMNREQRRLLQKQGHLDAEGNPISGRSREEARAPARGERVSPAQYLREVNTELRRVNWPTRQEVINYSFVTLLTLLLFTVLVSGFDFVFGEGIIQILKLAN